MDVSEKTLRAAVEKAGGTLEVTRHSGIYEVQAVAPEGKVWSADDLHYLLEVSAAGYSETPEQARAVLLTRLSRLEDCTDRDCPVCESPHPETTEKAE